MVAKKIELLFKMLGCSNSDIAKCVGCSPSNISRIHTGARVYDENSRPIRRFSDGVCIFAEKNNMLDTLCGILNCKSSSRDVLARAVIEWLYDDKNTEMPQVTVLPVKRRKRKHSTIFGGKLNDVMNMLELSNIRLARKVNTDPSCISRFRSGVRTPGSPLSEILAYELFSRIHKNNKVAELSKISGFSYDELSMDGNGIAVFSSWLYDTDKIPDIAGIDTLLDNIDKLPLKLPLQNKISSNELFSLIPEKIKECDKNIYWGKEGLREAVIRFLTNGVKSGGELLLYSDQNMDWMTEDKDFLKKWSMLMYACIQRGVKIKIIHNIERSMNEMLLAIQSWMPLYMSGSIEAYVCRRMPDSRFSHTFFINKDRECIFAAHINGTEEKGWYEYLTDNDMLNAILDEYTALLQKSVPLVKMFFDDYSRFLNMRDSKIISTMLSSLSLVTMPKKLLEGILEKNNIDEKKKKQIKDFYNMQNALLKKGLKEGSVTEYIVLPPKEEVISGRVRINVSQSLCDAEMFYTAEEYCEHVKALKGLIEKNRNYRIFILPELPFLNIEIINNGKSIAVIRSEKPYAAFVFTDAVMIWSFKGYFDMIRGKFGENLTDVKKRLEEYISNLEQ